MTSPDALINAYLDDDLDAAGLAELERWLQAEPANVRHFVQRAALHSAIFDENRLHDVATFFEHAEDDGETTASLLELDADHGHALGPLREIAPEALRPAGTRKAPLPKRFELRPNRSEPLAPVRHIVIPRIAVFAGIAAAIVLVIMVSWPDQPSIAPPSSPSSTSAPDSPLAAEARDIHVAYLAETVDAQWEGASPHVGAPLAANHYHLTQGFAHITFVDGASVIIEAPAEFRLDSESSMRAVLGRFVGHCPPGAEGFVVRTPGSRVIDLGTKFAVAVDADQQTEVQVMEGVIEVVLTQSHERRTLTRTQAIRIDASGEQIQTLEFDPFAFVRGLSPADRDPMRRYVHQVREAQPIAYWRFESIDAGAVVNEVDSRFRAEVIGQVRLDDDAWNRGAILGESGEGYLLVREPLDALRSTAEYTFEFWVEATRYNHATVLVLAAGNPDEDEAAYLADLMGDQGFRSFPGRTIRFLHRHVPGRDGGTNVFSTEPYPLNRPLHIVQVKAADRMILYVNGEAVRVTPDATALPEDLRELTIGWHRNHHDGATRQFHGRIDEVAIYDRALSADEVRRHHEVMPQRRGKGN